jgi:hypothetical protein
VTTQNTNHYSLTQGQVNILQAFRVQLMENYTTVLQCVSSILQMAITISVLPKGYNSYKSQFTLHTLIANVIFTVRLIIQLQLLGLTTIKTIAILKGYCKVLKV